MKLLRVASKNFKGCSDDIVISFVPKGQKSVADKEFELKQIADELYTFSTIGIVGKNASGKTTTMELLSIVYNILYSYKYDTGKERAQKYNNSPFNLDITFYHSGILYRYVTDIEIVSDLANIGNTTFLFKNEKVYNKSYCKTNASKIFDFDSYNLMEFESMNKPDEISILFSIIKDRNLRALYYTCNDYENYGYQLAFNIYKLFDNNSDIIKPVIKIFDDTIEDLKPLTDNNYEITFKNAPKRVVTDLELHDLLSSGTSKGFILMSYVTWSLKMGLDLLIDEVENHFHKTLVENLINLYKDKTVNKKNATLIFTTHYGELLDMFGRTDNIYVCHNDQNITIDNVYLKYKTRAGLLKSKKFYSNEFGTNVKYDYLMDLKKELMK